MKRRLPGAEARYFPRDLSWLAFNERVLEEAADRTTPLLERLNFVSIFVRNLDEFHMVRVAGLLRLVASGYRRKNIFGHSPSDLLREIRERLALLLPRLYALYQDRLLRDLARHRIFLRRLPELTEDQSRFVDRHFHRLVSPVVTPLAVDPGRPLPLLGSRTLSFAVVLSRRGKEHLVLVPVPKNLKRLIRLPAVADEHAFVLLDEVVRRHLPELFRGYQIRDAVRFRILRDSELSGEEEYAPNLLKAIEHEISRRPRARVVHAEWEKRGRRPHPLFERLWEMLEVPVRDLTLFRGDPDLSFLSEIVGEVALPALRYRPFLPVRTEYRNIFDRIKERDFLLHLPFQEFAPTVDLLTTAAADPAVLAIKMTLYRADEDSAVVASLREAARRGKQVTAVVELRARFDEERNIGWAKSLEEAGCHVVYGLTGMKIHSKITLVVRQEGGRIVRYVHLSTGNYNEKTARLYTDLGYFTANEDFAQDASDVFNVITGFSLPSRRRRLISAPHDLRPYLFRLLDQEVKNARETGHGEIFAKVNSLEDYRLIAKLYEASRAGVKIRLLVRGICCLVPGVPGQSDTIEVRSVVGRFLEHSRIFMFSNNFHPRAFLSSADWMRRNLDRRIELLFEVHQEDLKEQLFTLLESYWKDNAKSWILHPDGTYYRNRGGGPRFSVQEYLINYHQLAR